MNTWFRSTILVAAVVWACTGLRAASEVDELNNVLRKWDVSDAPGIAVVAVRDGEVIYRRCFGLASLEHAVPIRSDSVFYIASVSKQFTAAAVLLAAEEGKLRLDDSVRKYMPELPEYTEPITIRHLIHHTSGLRDYLWLMAWAGLPLENVYSEDDLVELIARQKKLNFAPGDEYSYTNSGYFLLSQIIKRATQRSLREYTQEKIFKPLGMNHTHFHDDSRLVVKNRVSAYARGMDGSYRLDWIPHWDKVGDGNLLTSVDDLVLWQGNLDSPRVGPPGFVDKMAEVATLNGGERTSYAAGLVIGDYRGLPTIGHAGTFAGFRANIIRFPQQRVSIICLANSGHIDPDKITRQLADIVLADQLHPVAQAFTELEI